MAFHRCFAVFREAVTKIVSFQQQMPCKRPGPPPPMDGSMHRKPQPTAYLHDSVRQLRIRHQFCLIPLGYGLKTRLKMGDNDINSYET